MTHNRPKVTKAQCWKVALAGDVAKPFLAGLLPRGLATNTDDAQRELGLTRRDQCHWAHHPASPPPPRDSVLQENKKTKGSWVGKGTRDTHRAQTQPHWVEPTRQESTIKDLNKTTTVPSSMPEKHNFRVISQVFPPPWLTSFLPDGSLFVIPVFLINTLVKFCL